jgi:hypothetical protein
VCSHPGVGSGCICSRLVWHPPTTHCVADAASVCPVAAAAHTESSLTSTCCFQVATQAGWMGHGVVPACVIDRCLPSIHHTCHRHLHAAVLLRLYLLPLPIQQHPSICCPAVSPCPLHVCSLRPPREQQLTLVACVAVWSRVLVFITARCVVSASSTAKKPWWPHLWAEASPWLAVQLCVRGFRPA